MKVIHQRSILFLVVALITSFVSSSSVQGAEKGYRYWGYFQAKPLAAKWLEAQTGPSVVMADGAVEGWIFTFSGGSIKKAAPPKTLPNFKKLCGATKAIPEKKRVGIVVDFGNAALAPKGEVTQTTIATCVVVDKKAIGLDVLAKVVKVRNSASGFVCGFNNYPKKECGVEIATPTALLGKK